MSRLGVWGDSITWGAVDYEMGGWVARLRHYIDNTLDDEPAVYNSGVSGDKITDVLQRFDVEYRARKPETIILAIGINDSPHDSHPGGTPLDVFEQKFNELVSKCLATSSKLIIVGLTNVDDGHPDRHGFSDKTIKPYTDVIKNLAISNNLPYVDLWGLITKKDLRLDGLHPGATGHEKIFQKVKESLGH